MPTLHHKIQTKLKAKIQARDHHYHHGKTVLQEANKFNQVMDQSGHLVSHKGQVTHMGQVSHKVQTPHKDQTTHTVQVTHMGPISHNGQVTHMGQVSLQEIVHSNLDLDINHGHLTQELNR